MKPCVKEEIQHGFREGVARIVSQVCTHPFERNKIHLQIHGINPGSLSFRGIFQSSIASGLIYSSYFAIYNSLDTHPLASTISSIITSIIKIPTNNSIRLFFVTPHASTIIDCTKLIFKKNGVKGLFTGYKVNILEDIIETNIRDKCYRDFKVNSNLQNADFINACIGAVSGSFAAALTTPFDTIKSNLVYQSSLQKINLPAIIYKSPNGILGLYRGMHLRAFNNAIRYALFYYILQLLH
jgi:hypothetical protein